MIERDLKELNDYQLADIKNDVERELKRRAVGPIVTT